MKKWSLFLFTAALSVVWLALAANGSADESFEEPPIELKAAEFVPEKLRSGKDYKLDSKVRNDGYTNSYRLATEWGELQAVSDFRLRARVREVEALRALDDMSRAGVFGDSLVDGALSPVEGAVALVTDPVETTKGAFEGVGKWFGGIADSATSDDPYQEGAISSAAGWAATKRGFAVELGVDPYTDWEPLQEALVSVGRAAFAGGLTASVAMGMATEDTVLEAPVLVLSLTNDMNKLLVDKTPEELTRLNKQKLLDMGIKEDLVVAFLKNYNYSPMEKLLLVEALHRMDGAKGREIFLADATAAPDKVVALYMQQRAEMMANYHTNVAEADLVELAEIPFQKTRDGRLVGLFPIDYLAWSGDTAAITKTLDQAIAQSPDIQSKELWFEGRVSQRSSAEFETAGWTVKEHAGMLIGEQLQTGEGSGAVSPASRGAAKVIPK